MRSFGKRTAIETAGCIPEIRFDDARNSQLSGSSWYKLRNLRRQAGDVSGLWLNANDLHIDLSLACGRQINRDRVFFAFKVTSLSFLNFLQMFADHIYFSVQRILLNPN